MLAEIDMRRAERPTFVVRLQAAPGIDPMPALRWLLRISLRQFGLRCLDIREEPADGSEHP